MNMKFIRSIGIVIVFVAVFCVMGSVQASVTISVISDTTIAYYEGVPTPIDDGARFSITNDGVNTLNITRIVVNSTSIKFDEWGGEWTCNQIEMSGEPYVEEEIICIPDDVIEINPGQTIDNVLSIDFVYENFGEYAGINGPNALSLEASVEGITSEMETVNLGSNTWNLTVTEDTPVNPDSTPETTSKVKGYIYFDDNNNDKRDDNEQGVEGVKIKLHYAGPNDKFDTGDDERYTDKTNEQGKYHFNNLASGAYRLKIENGQMIEFYLTSEKDTVNGKSSFSLDDGETKERDFGYDRDRDSKGNPKNSNLNYLQSGFTLSINNIINYLINLIK